MYARLKGCSNIIQLQPPPPTRTNTATQHDEAITATRIRAHKFLTNPHKHKRMRHQTTHEASKLETPDRLISLLPSPADQSSVTLKSVHWYCSDPIVPEQPLRQVRLPPPINVAAATVFASQLFPSVELLRQAMRWVNRIYR